MVSAPPARSPVPPVSWRREYATAVQDLESAIADDDTLGTPPPPLVSQDGSVALIEIPLAGAATDSQGEAAVATISSPA